MAIYPATLDEMQIFVVLIELRSANFECSSTGRARRYSYFGKIWNTWGKLDGMEILIDFNEGEFLQSAHAMTFSDVENALRDTECADRFVPPDDAIGYIGAGPKLEITEAWPEPFRGGVFLARSEYEAMLSLIDMSFRDGRQVSLRLSVIPKGYRRGAAPPELQDVDFSTRFEGYVLNMTMGRCSEVGVQI